MSLQGFSKKPDGSYVQRWAYLNSDQSKMKKEEEIMLVELYRKKCSIDEIVQKMTQRSRGWIFNHYIKFFRQNLRTIKKNLILKTTNDALCTQVKEG